MSSFEKRFWFLFDSCPDFASKSLRKFISDNKVFVSSKVSGADVDKAGDKHDFYYDIAITLFNERYWFFRFRPLLLNAPKDIQRVFIQHEIIHAFLLPIIHPLPEQIDYDLETSQIISDYIQAFLSPNPNFSDELTEETLVRSINKEWGFDETDARTWIESKSPSHNPRLW